MDDLISRQAAIDEIKEIYEWHDNVTKERIIEHFKQLPPANTSEIPNSSDTISRQAAIAYAISGRIRTLPTTEDGENWIRVSEVRESLIAMPSAQQWIPCSEFTGEGYPKENGFYYVTEQNYGFYLDADTRQKVAHTSPFMNGDFSDRYYDENYSNIVAWMPLPKPYEAERKEK